MTDRDEQIAASRCLVQQAARNPIPRAGYALHALLDHIEQLEDRVRVLESQGEPQQLEHGDFEGFAPTEGADDA